ncbi:ciliogenesis-associated TTC17-interacting protein [Passer montanus]|uniref:ciliogenesis-associated TTC17-interacting protein n=1 Tax=Passer montanus TaxID=9160 RepID=UPI0019620E2C|nr:ciliogenesis-associated TTC17-interacting protein [Passer montanus]
MEPAPQSAQDTASVADAAAEFLSLIGLKELEWCLFAETLAVVAAGAPPRHKAEGQWWMAAQWAPYHREGEPGQSCILVQTRFRGKQDGVPASSTLKAYVTWQLETLEQEEQECLEVTDMVVACPLPCVLPAALGCALHWCPAGGCPLWVVWHPLPCSDSSSAHQPGPHPLLWVAAGVGSFPQCIWNGTPTGSAAGAASSQEGALALPSPPCLPPLPQLRPHPTEKTTHIVSHEHGMTVTKTLQQGEAEPQCHSFSYGRARLRARLLEGASLLLLRVLARRQTVPPGLVLPAIDSEGHLCTSRYCALGIQRQALGSAETEVFVIQRVLHGSTGAPTVWHSSFLPNGRLAQMVQIGSPVLMILQDESILSKSGRFEPQLPFPKEPLDWEEDKELYSYFLDRKDELQLSHAAYLQQHPEVRALLSDFLQALLLQQPHDTISFAAEFFAHQRPIGTPFASMGAASPLPNSPAGHPPANSK